MVENTSEMIVTVDPEIYPLEAIFRTCYHFTDRAYLFLKRDHVGQIAVTITPKGSALAGSLRGEFANALIDFSVRWSINREAQPVRDALVRTALAEALPAK